MVGVNNPNQKSYPLFRIVNHIWDLVNFSNPNFDCSFLPYRSRCMAVRIPTHVTMYLFFSTTFMLSIERYGIVLIASYREFEERLDVKHDRVVLLSKCKINCGRKFKHESPICRNFMVGKSYKPKTQVIEHSKWWNWENSISGTSEVNDIIQRSHNPAWIHRKSNRNFTWLDYFVQSILRITRFFLDSRAVDILGNIPNFVLFVFFLPLRSIQFRI